MAPSPGRSAGLTAASTPDVASAVERLRAGDLRILARILTHVEAGDDFGRALVERVQALPGQAHRVVVTGVPGAGKSTLIGELAVAMRRTPAKVAIVAVDPSSPESGGAILGDRTRMVAHGVQDGIFIRSMASRGGEGGLARATHDVVDVLDAAGYGLVLLETVGVGQDAVEVAHAADTVVLVSAPGLGDHVQAIKAGVLEVADIHVVNKADRPDAQTTVMELRSMLAVAPSRRRPAVPVLAVSAARREGIDELARAIAAHGAELRAGDAWQRRRRARCEARLRGLLHATIDRRLADFLRQGGHALVEDVFQGRRTPTDALREMLEAVGRSREATGD